MEVKEELKKQGKRITALERFQKSFVKIKCRCCDRIFLVQKKDYNTFERQKLNFKCPFTAKLAKIM